MVPEDVQILYDKKQPGLETPESLLQTAWLNIMLHFGKRGRENQREMTADDIQIHKSSSGLEYITFVERATKNHQGGLKSNENEAAAVMSEMPGNPRCPVFSREDLLVEAKQAMSSALAEAEKSQCDEIQSYRRCMVLQRAAWKTQAGESSV